MTKVLVRTLLAGLAVAVVAPVAAAQTVVNSGFEASNPNGASNFTGYNTGAALQTGPGWTAVGPSTTGPGTVLAIGNAYSEPGITFNTAANGGLVSLDLTGAGTVAANTSGNVGIGSGVTQTLTNVSTTTAYNLTFLVGRATASSGTVYPTGAAGDAIVNLTLTGATATATTFTNTATTVGGVNWQQFTAVITPTSSTVGFTFTSGTATANYAGLDNVSFTPVPEPAAVGLLATAGLGLAGFVRRRLA